MQSRKILSVFDAGYIDDRWAYFVTPYCTGGDLDDLLERSKIGNLKALDLVANILKGLSHLHSQQLLHRDIKPSNVYINEVGEAVIGDFGSVKKYLKVIQVFQHRVTL
jgi:eukaryotic-like serine/threonine-protein kinase